MFEELPDDGYAYTCGYKYKKHDCRNFAAMMLRINVYNRLRGIMRYRAICNEHIDVVKDQYYGNEI